MRKVITEHIKQQPLIAANRLYAAEGAQCSWPAKAVFQALSMLSKCYVMKLLFVNGNIAESEMDGWYQKDSIALHKAALEELMNLRILILDSNSSVSKMFYLNPVFKSGILKIISYPVEPWSSGSSVNELTEKEFVPSKELLEKRSLEKWDDVLSFIMGILDKNFDNRVVEPTIRKAKLMQDVLDGSTGVYIKVLKINSKGYEFMLKDYLSQIWDFTIISILSATNKDEAWSFLLMLSYCEYGKGYPVNALTSCQRQLMFELSEFGIIYLHDVSASKFYPTRVAIDLIFEQRTVGSRDTVLENPGQQLRVIVETNFQVVAYVYSNLHLAMLELFVDVTLRLPNMAFGRITREKSKAAFRIGIKAAQIIDFLLLHAHPVMKKELPVSVTDQFALWEAESARISVAEACVVDCRDIPGVSKEMYKLLVASMESQGALLWSEERTLMIAIPPKSLNLLQQFFLDNLGYA